MTDALVEAGVDVSQQRRAFDELRDIQGKYGELAVDGALAAGGALPPPFGTGSDVIALGRSLWKGNWGDALFDVVGFAPLFGDGIKGGRIAAKLVDLRRAIDQAVTGLGRSFAQTRRVALDHWDNIIKRNEQAYLDAVASCGTNKACRESKAIVKGPQYNFTPKSGPNGQWVGDRGDGVWRPANGGPAVKYENGFPDYGPHSKGDVEIAMTGNNIHDFTAADDAMRYRLDDPDWERPPRHTWHHNEDGVTMQLIPSSIHATRDGASTPHMGGAALYRGGQSGEF